MDELPPPRRRRRGNALLAVGGALLALLVAVALAAPLITPADPAEQLDPVAGRYLPPGSERFALTFGDGRSLLAERAEREGDEIAVVRLGHAERYPAAAVVDLRPDGRPRRRTFLLGTDRFSRDLWCRLVWGARVSLAVGLLAGILALSLGVAVGATAVVGGPIADGVLMRTVDAVISLPRLFLLLALVAFFRPGVVTVVLILGGTGWMTTSRLVRAEMLSLQQRDFVVAARAIGQTRLRILTRHLLPNALTPVLVQIGLLVGDVILAESTLSFLGLGIPPPTPSWGNLIADGSDRLIQAWWLATFPGLAIVLTVVAFNLLADGLRDALDPRRAH
jgi:peptide/nickel transport system permease protein